MEGTTQIAKIYNHQRVAALTPAYRYDGKEDFAAWQARAKAQLALRLGMDKFEKCDPQMTVEWKKEQDYGTEVRITFSPEKGYRLPAHLLLPKTTEKRPAVICLQGHSKGMHISLGREIYPGDAQTIAGGRDFAVQAVKEGYVAIAMEQRSFGECGGTEKGPDCHEGAMSALLFGRTAIGERVWDISRLIDLLCTEFADRVDTDRIVCTGNSGGGTATFYASCMDERIAVSMPSCAFCTYKDSIAAMKHCVCNFIPGIALDFDMGDLCGLIAPRPLMIMSGVEDKIFPIHGVEECYAVCRQLYAAAGAPDACRLLVGDKGHQYYPELAWPYLKTVL
ncbi:MAG: acetylxylan esterase [Clostridia bacterium]|nr:acetylxylan esterase [Clostridia bacterium]